MESAGNSTIQTLDASTSSFDTSAHVYDGTPQDTEGYNYIHTIVNAGQPGLLRIRHSIDSELWDITDTYTYPTDVSLGYGMFNMTPVKARFCNVQFENMSASANNIRLQTLLNNDGCIAPPSLVDVSYMDVCVINHSPINVFVVNDVSSVILNTLDNPVPVHIIDTCLNVTVVNPISGDVFITNTDPINITGNVTVQNTPLIVKEDAITQVWESDNIDNTTIVNLTSSSIYTIIATNFAPDFRYIKLYNSYTVNPQTDLPRLTIPLPPDIPQTLQFGSKGLLFNTCLLARATRMYNAKDENMAMPGDVAISIMFDY